MIKRLLLVPCIISMAFISTPTSKGDWEIGGKIGVNIGVFHAEINGKVDSKDSNAKTKEAGEAKSATDSKTKDMEGKSNEKAGQASDRGKEAESLDRDIDRAEHDKADAERARDRANDAKDRDGKMERHPSDDSKGADKCHDKGGTSCGDK